MEGYEYLVGVDIEKETRIAINNVQSDFKSEIINKLINGIKGEFQYDCKIGNTVLEHFVDDNLISTEELQKALLQSLRAVPSNGTEYKITISESEYADAFIVKID